MGHKYASEYPILDHWDKTVVKDCGPVPTAEEIEAAKKCMVSKRQALVLALGFRLDGSHCKQRTKAHDNTPEENVGALGELRRKQYGEYYKYEIGNIYPTKIKSRIWVLVDCRGNGGYWKFEFADGEIVQELEQIGDADNKNAIFSRRVVGEYARRLSEIAVTECWAWVKKRSYQAALKHVVLQERNKECQLTKLDIPELLEACHIVPVREDKEYGGKPDNVLLLAVHIHKLFDAYLISFDETGKIMISTRLKSDARKSDALAILGLSADMHLTDHARHQPFLGQHRAEFMRQEPLPT